MGCLQLQGIQKDWSLGPALWLQGLYAAVWEKSSWKAAWQKKTWGMCCLSTIIWMWASSVPMWPKRPMVPLRIRNMWTAVLGRDCPLILVRPHLKRCAWFWTTYYKDFKLFKYMQRTTKSVKRLENKISDGWLRELGLFDLEKTRLRGEFITPCNCLKEGCCKEDFDLFSQMTSWRTLRHLPACLRRGLDSILENKYLREVCMGIGRGYPGEYRVSIPRDTSETSGCGAYCHDLAVDA